MTDETKTALAKLAREAIAVQDACNLSGVLGLVWRTREVLNRAKNELGEGTDWFNHHPIMVVLSDKIANLTRSNNYSVLSSAYDECARLGKSKEAYE